MNPEVSSIVNLMISECGIGWASHRTALVCCQQFTGERLARRRTRDAPTRMPAAPGLARITWPRKIILLLSGRSAWATPFSECREIVQFSLSTITAEGLSRQRLIACLVIKEVVSMYVGHRVRMQYVGEPACASGTVKHGSHQRLRIYAGHAM